MLILEQPAKGFFSEKTTIYGSTFHGMPPYLTDSRAQQFTGVTTAKAEPLMTPVAPKTDVRLELLAKTAVLMNYYAKLWAHTLKLTLLYLYAVSKKYTPLVLNAMGDALVRSFNALNYYGEVLANRTRLCWARLTGYDQFDDEKLLKYIQQNIDVLYEDFMHVAQGHYCSTVDQDALVEQESIDVDIGHLYSGGKHSFTVDVKNMDTMSILDIAKCIAIKQEIEEQVAKGGSLPPVEAMNYIFAHRGTLAKPVVEQSFDELSTLLPNR